MRKTGVKKHNISDIFTSALTEENRLSEYCRATETEETAFIWDLDGTILDSYAVIVPCLYKTCLEFNIAVEEKDILNEVITRTVGSFISKLERETGISRDAFKENYSERNNREMLKIRPIKNAAEILSFLKNRGIPNYMFTHRDPSTETLLKNAGLFDFFEEIVTSQDGFARKPDPSAVNYLVRKYDLDKDHTYYVGDRTLDIECADNAGIRSILYIPEGSPAKACGKETFIITDLAEIKEIVL